MYIIIDAGTTWKDVSDKNFGDINDMQYVDNTLYMGTSTGVYKLYSAFTSDTIPIGYALGSSKTFSLNWGSSWRLEYDHTKLNASPSLGSSAVSQTITVSVLKDLLNQKDSIEKVTVYASVTGQAVKQDILLGEKYFKHDVFYVENDTLYLNESPGNLNIITTAPWTLGTSSPWLDINKNGNDININTQFTGDQADIQQLGNFTINTTLLGSKTITVIYSPYDMFLNTSKKTLKLNSTNAKDSIIISSNMIWAVDNTYSWLTQSKSTGSGSTKIYFTAPDNNTNAQRLAIINIYKKYDLYHYEGAESYTILITQDANPNAIQCPHQALILNSNLPTLCDGDSLTLIANSGTGFIYQWFVDGAMVQGGGNSSLACKKPGIYTVAVTNNNCTASSNTVKVNFHPTTAKPIITKQSGEIKPCTGGSIILTTTTVYSKYLWNTAETTANIAVSKSDKYSVSITDENGCSAASELFEINASKSATPSMCVVTVGPATGKNVIVWKRESGQHIKNYVIYKESVQANVYNVLATVAYDGYNFVVDENSNPAIRSNRYAISAIDSCDIESPKSLVHKTLHLTLNQRYGGGVNLIWENYEGLDILSYVILEGDAKGDIKELVEVPSNITTYTILDNLKKYYQIAINLKGSCELTSLLKAESGPYSQSLSNIAEFKTSSISNESNSGISVFPNPCADQFTVQYTLAENTDVAIAIYNVLGEKVADKTFANQPAGIGQQMINGNELNMTSGVYVIKIKIGDDIQTLKVIYRP